MDTAGKIASGVFPLLLTSTGTGTEWPEVREHLRGGLDRFINAIEDRSVDGVVSAGIEMQAAFSRILLEAYVIRAGGKMCEGDHSA